MRKKTFSLILSGILPITALSFTAFANGGDTATIYQTVLIWQERAGIA